MIEKTVENEKKFLQSVFNVAQSSLAEIVEVERWRSGGGRVAIYRPFGEVSLSLNRTVTCMVLKANDRRTSCPCHDEFRGPRSDYVRQVALATTTQQHINILIFNLVDPYMLEIWWIRSFHGVEIRYKNSFENQPKRSLRGVREKYYRF
ncbi:uncharacterized protein TNCV_1285101 [Trichonephila clavipes]|uniref:Uncharacterized protein n=1 Tax=Trichonephila clavipes TaxID=2585209 RepID=A0A8X6SQJ5_TRICX|nr:uncharacterized protein TNCV_1285101 [Trichonephila clavipes]